MPSSPLLQPQPLFPQKPPNIPLSPPHKNSRIKIMKIGLMPLSQVLSLEQDADDRSLIIEPPNNFYNTSYEK
jgi:hypothetical protein